ncbi:DNA-processing protein DprA [uncultured Oscillibacter sp.]|uniref:DNA-processing protein DprA n=1 Tax=uncultured Oscillibacter sp. TaxID=876091 RepID=UPI00262552E7|nr:DNA-processing protein DprA [uncultured Oscillibacter sp.]
MLKYWLWLAELPGLTNQARLAFLRHFGTPENAFYADAGEILLTEGVAREQAEALEEKSLAAAEKILEDCRRLGLRILTFQDAEYPNRLRNIYDPPFLLYVRGHLPPVDEEPVITVVGTRRCTPYGETCGEKLGYGLARGGAAVVSGLARGVDAAATRGALRGGGVPIGVLGCGLDVVYPPEHRYLYEDVAAAGALLSEYPPGTEPAGRNFPVRNRIMAGLSVGTVVVEAPLRSGALITGKTAQEHGRDLFAVPGPIDAPASAGCNRILRDGGIIVTEPRDVLDHYAGRFPDKLRLEASGEEPETLGYQARRERAEPPRAVPPSLSVSGSGLTDDQIALLRALTEEPRLVDGLIEETGIPARRVLSALTLLELDGHITQYAGKRYARAVTLTE